MPKNVHCTIRKHVKPETTRTVPAWPVRETTRQQRGTGLPPPPRPPTARVSLGKWASAGCGLLLCKMGMRHGSRGAEMRCRGRRSPAAPKAVRYRPVRRSSGTPGPRPTLPPCTEH